MSYQLAEHEGMVCVTHTMRLDNEPFTVTVFWPTTVPVHALASVYQFDAALLGKIKVRQCQPGMFLCCIDVQDDATLHNNYTLHLKEFGKTQPIRVERAPVPPPKGGWETKYENGYWWVKLPSGWKKRS